MSPDTTTPGRPTRRAVMMAGAWAAPAVVATVASPAYAASPKYTIEFWGAPEVEPNSALGANQLAVVLRESGRVVFEPQEVNVEIGKGVFWGAPGSTTSGRKTFTTEFGVVKLGGSDNPIAVAGEAAYPIVAYLTADPTVIAWGYINVTSAAFTVRWAEPTWVTGYVGEALDVATSLTATRRGTGVAGIALAVEPTANLAWASGAQGTRSVTTAAQGKVSFPSGTFLPKSHEVHALTASVATSSGARDELRIFAIPRASKDWVKDAWVIDGKLTVAIDAEAYDGAYRLIDRVNGVHYMESYSKTPYDSTARRAGDNVVLTRLDSKNSVKVVSGGDRLEVFLAPNKPGEDSSGAVKVYDLTVADPPAEAFTWVKQVTLQGSSLHVTLDRAAFEGPYRIQVRNNQDYVMESFNGTGFYSQKVIGATTVQITHNSAPAKKGDVIEVYLATGEPGYVSAGRWRIAAFTV